MIAAAGDDNEARISFLYRTVLSRRPTSDEIELLDSAFAIQHELFLADEESARDTVDVGESEPVNIAPAAETAAWAMIANLVLNLDETITRN